MSGFEQLEQAILPIVPSQIPAEEVAWAGEELSDETALGIVLADVEKAEQFIQSKKMVLDWEQADFNYRAYGLPKNWPGTETVRAGLAMPVIMEAVEKLMPAVMLAFFSDKVPFYLERRGKTTDDVLRAKTNLLVWALKESGFKEEIRRALKSCILYGFTVLRWGWKTVKRTKKSYGYAPGGKKVTRNSKEYEISHPTIEAVSLRNFLGDPTLQEQDVRKGKANIVQCFVTAGQLDSFRSDPTYKNVPTREELAQILAIQNEPTTDSMIGSKWQSYRDLQAQPQTLPSSLDPTKADLEIVEYVTDERIITVLQRKIVIRNSANNGDTGFLSCAFIDVPGAMYGFGVSTLLAGEQYLQTDIQNKGLDALALQITPAFTAEQGLQTTAQNIKIRTGQVVTGPQLKPIVVPDVQATVQNAIQQSELRAARRVGANGGDNMPTQAMRTAEGVQAFGQDIVNKMQYFIEIFAEQVYIPALRAFLEIMHDKLQPEDIHEILSEMDEKALAAFDANPLDVYNGDCDVMVLSSTKLAARRAAAQLIPLLLSLVSADPVQSALAAQGKKFDFAELVEEAVDLAGWDVNSLIVPASQEEIQRMMTMSAPQAAKAQMDAQAKSQLMQQQQGNELEKIEATGLMRAGVDVIRHTVKPALESGAGLG